MNIEQVEKYLQMMQHYDLKEFELKEKDSVVRFVSNKDNAPRNQNPTAPNSQYTSSSPVTVPSSQPMKAPLQAPFALEPAEKEPLQETQTGETILSPFVGTFYASSSPNSPDFVQEGQKITKGTVLCIVEAMKLMNEIESEFAGTITKILVKNESPVEYNQPLFIIDPQ